MVKEGESYVVGDESEGKPPSFIPQAPETWCSQSTLGPMKTRYTRSTSPTPDSEYYIPSSQPCEPPMPWPG